MIQFNLKEQKWRPYEDYGKYGYISSQRFPEYQSFNVTIINDLELNKYDRLVGLIHLSPSVRVVQELSYPSDIQYLRFSPGSDGLLFNDYKKVQQTAEESLAILREIFYKIQPRLQSQTLLGFNKDKGLEFDPNEADGVYLLNDEELYFLKRKNGKILYSKGGIISPSYPFVMPDNKITLAEEFIDYELYKLSIEYSLLQNQISIHSNRLLQSGELLDMVERFNELEQMIDAKLEQI